jgi:hypothetical protein
MQARGETIDVTQGNAIWWALTTEVGANILAAQKVSVARRLNQLLAWGVLTVPERDAEMQKLNTALDTDISAKILNAEPSPVTNRDWADVIARYVIGVQEGVADSDTISPGLYGVLSAVERRIEELQSEGENQIRRKWCESLDASDADCVSPCVSTATRGYTPHSIYTVGERAKLFVGKPRCLLGAPRKDYPGFKTQGLWDVPVAQLAFSGLFGGEYGNMPVDPAAGVAIWDALMEIGFGLMERERERMTLFLSGYGSKPLVRESELCATVSAYDRDFNATQQWAKGVRDSPPANAGEWSGAILRYFGAVGVKSDASVFNTIGRSEQRIAELFTPAAINSRNALCKTFGPNEALCTAPCAIKARSRLLGGPVCALGPDQPTLAPRALWQGPRIYKRADAKEKPQPGTPGFPPCYFEKPPPASFAQMAAPSLRPVPPPPRPPRPVVAPGAVPMGSRPPPRPPRPTITIPREEPLPPREKPAPPPTPAAPDAPMETPPTPAEKAARDEFERYARERGEAEAEAEKAARDEFERYARERSEGVAPKAPNAPTAPGALPDLTTPISETRPPSSVVAQINSGQIPKLRSTKDTNSPVPQKPQAPDNSLSGLLTRTLGPRRSAVEPENEEEGNGGGSGRKIVWRPFTNDPYLRGRTMVTQTGQMGKIGPQYPQVTL